MADDRNPKEDREKIGQNAEDDRIETADDEFEDDEDVDEEEETDSVDEE